MLWRAGHMKASLCPRRVNFNSSPPTVAWNNVCISRDWAQLNQGPLLSDVVERISALPERKYFPPFLWRVWVSAQPILRNGSFTAVSLWFHGVGADFSESWKWMQSSGLCPTLPSSGLTKLPCSTGCACFLENKSEGQGDKARGLDASLAHLCV